MIYTLCSSLPRTFENLILILTSFRYLKKVIKVAFALAAINNPSAIQYAERDFGVSAKEWAVSLVRYPTPPSFPK